MPDMEFFTPAFLDRISGVSVLAVIAVLVITDRLVWHTRLRETRAQAGETLQKAEKRADRWEKIALEALTIGAMSGVRSAEVTASIVTSLKDAEQERTHGE